MRPTAVAKAIVEKVGVMPTVMACGRHAEARALVARRGVAHGAKRNSGVKPL